MQSVALRIICDREEEINSFIPEEYWSLDGAFKIHGEKKPLQAKFYGTDKKLPIHNKAEMDEILKKLENAEYQVTEVKKGERIKNAPLPFTTSTLQQMCIRDRFLAAHEPFTSAEEAVSKGNDIVSSQMAVHYSSKRRLVGDTDNGKALRERIQELTRLLEAYRKGIIKETK